MGLNLALAAHGRVVEPLSGTELDSREAGGAKELKASSCPRIRMLWASSYSVRHVSLAFYHVAVPTDKKHHHGVKERSLPTSPHHQGNKMLAKQLGLIQHVYDVAYRPPRGL